MSNKQQQTWAGDGNASRGGVLQLRLGAQLLLSLWGCLAYGGTPAPEIIGRVSIADGEPFRIVRGDNLLSGSRGVELLAEDIVATGANSFVAIVTPAGSLMGIGPSTEVYFVHQTSLTTVRALKGWVKADIRDGAVRLEGTRLAIQGRQAVALLHADERSDAIFDEQGPALLLPRDDNAVRGDRNTVENQFFVREDRFDVSVQPRPSEEFVRAMPPPFRDPLPGQVKLPEVPKPHLLRPVSYADIEDWLTSPRDWRAGFVKRFRPRLKDPAFFAAMDAHLNVLPEWREILHPPPSAPPPR